MIGLAFTFYAFSDTTYTQRRRIISSNPILLSYPLPEKVIFCGEEVPLEDDYDVRERLDKEITIAVYNHSSTILAIKKANRWKEEMMTILKSEGVPEDFFYLMIAESGVSNVTSNRGAKGYWQFIPMTAKQYRLEISDFVDMRNDPIASTYAACKYLKDAYKKFGNWTAVAASYNMGMGGINRQMVNQKSSNYYDLWLNQETSRYLFRIIALKTLMTQPELYGYKIMKGDLYDPIPFSTVTVTTNIPDLVTFAYEQGTNLKHLKLMNPWLLKESLPVAAGKSYTLRIPKQNWMRRLIPIDLIPITDTIPSPDQPDAPTRDLE